MTTAIQFISAVVTRIIFVGHAGLVVWMLVQTTPNGVVYWSLLTGIALLAIEAAFTLGYRKGFEHRYLWPSCFFYLCTMVPCVWIIELDMMQRRINKDESLPIFYIGSEKFSLQFTRNFAELGLVLVIIGGRWMLPRGTITRDQLSALLLEYVGIAVDILELFGSFEKDEMSTNHTVTVIILSVYSWSLLQFTFSSTALNEEKEEADEEEERKQIEDELLSEVAILALPANQCKYIRKLVMQRIKQDREKRRRKAIKKRYRAVDSPSRAQSLASLEGELQMKKMQLHGDSLGILAGIFMQDGPFLAVRLYLIFGLGIADEKELFFAGKNIVTIALLLYRLFAIQCVDADEEEEITPYERVGQASFAVVAAKSVSLRRKRVVINENIDINGNISTGAGPKDRKRAREKTKIQPAPWYTVNPPAISEIDIESDRTRIM
ncbi:transmembrane protein 26 [Nematostella vectensis]|uniref:transmembrane protein 26 n=1 Tax=Nematostella vectensis TaxID=45351 RepID=UPI0020770DDF|nr:transmembrane protein 26 [Nematostella vectensis]